MKGQKQPSRSESIISALDSIKTIILTVLGLCLLIGLIVAFVKVQFDKSSDDGISIEEAQDKCMLINEYNQVNELGKEYSQSVVKEAERFCLTQWSDPEREKAFKKSVPLDWEAMKDKTLNGYTLEQLYNEAHSK